MRSPWQSRAYYFRTAVQRMIAVEWPSVSSLCSLSRQPAQLLPGLKWTARVLPVSLLLQPSPPGPGKARVMELGRRAKERAMALELPVRPRARAFVGPALGTAPFVVEQLALAPVLIEQVEAIRKQWVGEHRPSGAEKFFGCSRSSASPRNQPRLRQPRSELEPVKNGHAIAAPEAFAVPPKAGLAEPFSVSA